MSEFGVVLIRFGAFLKSNNRVNVLKFHYGGTVRLIEFKNFGFGVWALGWGVDLRESLGRDLRLARSNFFECVFYKMVKWCKRFCLVFSRYKFFQIGGRGYCWVQLAWLIILHL